MNYLKIMLFVSILGANLTAWGILTKDSAVLDMLSISSKNVSSKSDIFFSSCQAALGLFVTAGGLYGVNKTWEHRSIRVSDIFFISTGLTMVYTAGRRLVLNESQYPDINNIPLRPLYADVMTAALSFGLMCSIADYCK